eukprot:scaffold7128_cov114-Isochrysis_galbana.AAC.3
MSTLGVVTWLSNTEAPPCPPRVDEAIEMLTCLPHAVRDEVSHLLVQRREPALGQAGGDGVDAHLAQQLGVGPLCQEARHDGAARCARDDPRQHPHLKQSSHHPHVVHGQRPAARQAERRVAERQLRRAEELQLPLQPDLPLRRVHHALQRA